MLSQSTTRWLVLVSLLCALAALGLIFKEHYRQAQITKAYEKEDQQLKAFFSLGESNA